MINSIKSIKILALAFLITTGFYAKASENTNSILPKIVGGTNASPTNWPYMTALLSSPVYNQTQDIFLSQFCAGTLIDESWVITAAHCVEGTGITIPIESILVSVGAYNLNINDGAIKNVKRIIKNPNFDENNLINGYDVALIELESPVTGIEPVELAPIKNVFSNRTGTIIGWGSLVAQDETHNNQPLFPTILQQANIDIISSNFCNSYYGFTFNETILCAGEINGGIGTCQGDSGGPLLAFNGEKYIQVGITSSGVGCALAGQYGIYTDVAGVKDFIDQNIGASLEKSLGKDYTGVWFNPTRSGEGWVVEFLDNNRMLAYWFTYDNNNNPLYIYGAGDYDPEQNSVTINAYRTHGAKFGNSFNSEDAISSLWGSMTLTFNDCFNGKVDYDGRISGYEAGSSSVKRLTVANSSDCITSTDNNLNGTGVWFLPERSGEGFTAEVHNDGRISVYWFTYDLNGSPLYLYGTSNFNNSFANIHLQRTEGTSFGTAFNADDVRRINWGRINFQITGCNNANVAYESFDPSYGSGEFVGLKKVAFVDGACKE